MDLKGKKYEVIVKNGVQQLTFEEGPRFYKREGEPKSHWRPSVTTILSIVMSDDLFDFYLSVGREFAREIMIEAGAKGTAFHWCKEAQFLGLEVDPKDETQALLDSMKEAEGTYQIKTLASEAFIISDTHGYAGSLDGIFSMLSMDLETIADHIGDYKTGHQAKNKFGYQLGAYWGAWKEMFDKNCSLVAFSVKKKKTKVLYYDQPEEWFRKFLNIFELWQDENREMLERMEWKWLSTKNGGN